jgi:hypothetical protein
LYSGVSVSEICTSVVANPRSRRPVLQPAREERLARAVVAAHRLEAPTARGDRVQLLVDRALEALEPDREQLEPAARHGADAQRLDDLARLSGLTGAADGSVMQRRLRSQRQLELLGELVDVEVDLLVLAIVSEHLIAVDVQDLLEPRHQPAHAGGELAELGGERRGVGDAVA